MSGRCCDCADEELTALRDRVSALEAQLSSAVIERVQVTGARDIEKTRADAAEALAEALDDDLANAVEKTEAATVEAIAAWLEARTPNHFCFTAAEIRAGDWKKKT